MAESTSRKRRMKRPSGGTVILLVTLLLGVTVLAPTVQQFVAQRQRIADLQSHIETVQTEVGELQTEQARWNDPAYIQAQARGRLLFVKPGETTYLVTDSNGGRPVQAPADSRPEMHETETDWVESLAQSFVASGFANGPGPGQTGVGPAPAGTDPAHTGTGSAHVESDPAQTGGDPAQTDSDAAQTADTSGATP